MATKGIGTRLKRLTRFILRATYRGLKAIFGDMFRNPRKFITVMTVLIVVVLLSYYATFLAFLIPVGLFYAGLWIGREAYERKKRKRLGIIGLFIISMFTVAIILPSTIAYMVYENSTILPAKVPESYLDAGSGNGWYYDKDGSLSYSMVEQGGLVRIESRGYAFDGGSKPPYPGLMILITVKSVPMTSSLAETDWPWGDSTLDTVMDQLEQQIFDLDEQDYQGLQLARGSKVTGSRTLADGSVSIYFDYNGKIEQTPSDPLLERYVSGGKLKIRGEAWACYDSGTIVSVAGTAQYGYTFEPGTFGYGQAQAQREYPDDYRTWTTLKNIISNVECS